MTFKSSKKSPSAKANRAKGFLSTSRPNRWRPFGRRNEGLIVRVSNVGEAQPRQADRDHAALRGVLVRDVRERRAASLWNAYERVAAEVRNEERKP